MSSRIPKNLPRGKSLAIFGLSYFILVVAGCGAPGEPVPPIPPLPAPISDLVASQDGDAVDLSFTMPSKNIAGDPILEPPAIEILRGIAKPDGSPDLGSLRIVQTIPGALTAKYLQANKIQFAEVLSPEQLKSQTGFRYTYVVRTRISRKRVSANSNTASVQIFSPPEKITALHADIAENEVNLTWTAAARTSDGDPLPSPPHYNVYRADLLGSTLEECNAAGSDAVLKSNLKLLATQTETAFQDKSFEFRKCYAYIVRAVVSADSVPVESGTPSPTMVFPRDLFPPAPPTDLIAAVSSGPAEATLAVDLSWSINTEPDFAGYRVYRTERQDARGEVLNSDLLLTPSLRDTSVQPSHQYWYTVTAVDRAGNESAPSTALFVEVAQPFP